MLVKFKVGAFPVFFGKTSSRSKHSFPPSGLATGSVVPLRAIFFGVYIWQSERYFLFGGWALKTGYGLFIVTQKDVSLSLDLLGGYGDSTWIVSRS